MRPINAWGQLMLEANQRLRPINAWGQSTIEAKQRLRPINAWGQLTLEANQRLRPINAWGQYTFIHIYGVVHVSYVHCTTLPTPGICCYPDKLWQEYCEQLFHVCVLFSIISMPTRKSGSIKSKFVHLRVSFYCTVYKMSQNSYILNK